LTENSQTDQEDIKQSLPREEENELVKNCIDGNQVAWNKLVDIYGPRVYTAIRYFMRSYRESMPSEAKNVYQELFLDLCNDNFRKLKTYQGDGKFAKWLLTVARRRTLTYIRNALRYKRVPAKLKETEILDLGRPLFESGNAYDSSEARDAVLQALEKIDEKSRLLIVLFYFEDMSYEDIAKLLDISKTSITSLMRKAREEIEKILEE